MLTHSLSSQRPTGAQLFQAWLNTESWKAFQALSPEPQGVYETIWNAWLQSLHVCTDGGIVTSTKAWHEAHAEDAAHFLRIRSGQKAHHQPDRLLSAVTRRRYWRVLDRIYDHAVIQGWIGANPFIELPRAEQPQAVDQLGHCLPPALWARLPRHFPDSDSLQGARDHAVLWLLYELALAPEEVRALGDAHLLDGLRCPLGPEWAQVPAALQIEGARKAQRRILPLSPRLGQAIATWRQWRHAHDPHLEGWLFHSRKGGPLSIRALFHVASKVIQAAHAAQPSSESAGALQRVGPQVLRNTAIVTWLRSGLSEAEVVQRIGVESPRALGHLRHQVPLAPALSAPQACGPAPASEGSG
ncbi:MAG: site-specific integrase [Burkholderiaceae bacterium]|nr:site-specific integrase [Burkholderiaceae bacterium]